MPAFIGFSEIIFIVAIFFLLFGSKNIPEMARFLGKGIRDIRKAAGEVKKQITEDEAPERDAETAKPKEQQS